MRKQEFLAELRKGLAGLPQEDMEQRLTFYGEMVDDRIEEGLLEETAVSAIGPVEEIVRQTVADVPLAKLAKERIKPKRRLKVWEVVLLALGSPIWLCLGVSLAAVVLTLYLLLFALSAVLWVVFGALAVGAAAGVLAGVIFAAHGSGAAGLAVLGAGIVCAGLAIFLFFGCKQETRGILLLTKKITIGLKNSFIKKGEAE